MQQIQKLFEFIAFSSEAKQQQQEQEKLAGADTHTHTQTTHTYTYIRWLTHTMRVGGNDSKHRAEKTNAKQQQNSSYSVMMTVAPAPILLWYTNWTSVTGLPFVG